MEFWVLEKERKGFGETNSSSCHSFDYSMEGNCIEEVKASLEELLFEYITEEGKYGYVLKPFKEEVGEFNMVGEYEGYKAIWNFILAGARTDTDKKYDIKLFLSEFFNVSLEEIYEPSEEVGFDYLTTQATELALGLVDSLNAGLESEVFFGTIKRI